MPKPISSVSGACRPNAAQHAARYPNLARERGITRTQYHRDVIWPMLALRPYLGGVELSRLRLGELSGEEREGAHGGPERSKGRAGGAGTGPCALRPES